MKHMKHSINIQLTAGFGLCVLLLAAVVGFNFSSLWKLGNFYHEAERRTGEMALATDAQHIGEDLYQILGNAANSLNATLQGAIAFNAVF